MVNPPPILTDPDDDSLVVSSLVSFLVHQSPSLEALGKEELKHVARSVVFDTLKEDLKARVEFEKIDYAEKKATFLARAAKRSIGTSKTYKAALDALEGWAERSGLIVLALRPKDADAFIDSLDGAPSTIRLKVAACSSFFTFLERETEGRIRNPFRGTKARPKKQTKEPEVPNIEEIEIIRESVAPAIQAAITVMVEHGLRVGALPSLTIRAGRYTATSKGKEVSGMISETAFGAIKKAGLNCKKPFIDLANEAVRNAFKHASMKLFKASKIKAAYSVHDLRHYFAICEYNKDKDIYRLKSLLGHASIQVTETYLRGIEAYWKY